MGVIIGIDRAQSRLVEVTLHVPNLIEVNVWHWNVVVQVDASEFDRPPATHSNKPQCLPQMTSLHWGFGFEFELRWKRYRRRIVRLFGGRESYFYLNFNIPWKRSGRHACHLSESASCMYAADPADVLSDYVKWDNSKFMRTIPHWSITTAARRSRIKDT